MKYATKITFFHLEDQFLMIRRSFSDNVKIGFEMFEDHFVRLLFFLLQIIGLSWETSIPEVIVHVDNLEKKEFL